MSLYSDVQFGSGTQSSYYLGGGAGPAIGATGSTSQLMRYLKSEEYSLLNRLRSIQDDRAFAADVYSRFPSLALFANLRCGLWYVPSFMHDVVEASEDSASAAASLACGAPENASASDHAAPSKRSPIPQQRFDVCYFKSTDGHAHHWKFSTLR